MKRYKHRVIADSDRFVVGSIDLMSFGRLHCWNGQRLETELGKAGTTCLVALRPNSGVGSAAIAGFVIYRSNMELVRIAVDEEFRRQGVGRSLVERVARHLKPSRPELVVNVSDAFLPGAHLFFKSCGFRPAGVMRKHDGYQDWTRLVLPLATEAVV